MKYYQVIEKRKVGNIYEIVISGFDIEPKPGQFVSLILPNEAEIPLGVGDYEKDLLKLYIESENLVKRIGKRVLIKGPLGKQLELNGVRKIIGITTPDLFHDIKYPLKVAKKRGIDVKCIGCNGEYDEPMDINDSDLILVSMRLEDLKKHHLPKDKVLVYNRWVKMNCMLGVCGECEVKGKLTCIEGPFMRLDEIVD
ncbi:MAG: 2-polyprenylphenol hydroxylase [Saccharolobus sp.]